MPDIQGLVSDPRFQAFPLEERLRALEKIGAPAEFVQKYGELQSGGPGPSISAQPERGPGNWLRNWLAGMASDRRITQQERESLREAGVPLEPTAVELGTVAATPALVALGAGAPGPTALGVAGGVPGAVAGESIARAAGERIAPGVGDLTGEVGAVAGGLATGGAATLGPQLVRRGVQRAAVDSGRLATEMGRTAARAGQRIAEKSKGAVSGRAAGEMVLEGALDTALSVVPGGSVVSGLVRRAGRKAGRETLARFLQRPGRSGGATRPSGSAFGVEAGATPAANPPALVQGAQQAAREFGLKPGAKVYNITVAGKVLQWFETGAKAGGALRALAKKHGWTRVGTGQYRTPDGQVVETSWTLAMRSGG